jgi:hypothetical protein
MTVSLDSLLIAATFATQIFLLAYYLPRRRRRHYEMIFACYPQAEYPRLYPVPQERMARTLALLDGIKRLIGVAAVVVLALGFVYAESTFEYGRWMMLTLIAQLLPAILSMPWVLKTARAFRTMPPPAVRSTELRTWRIVDFVSPFIIGLGLAASVLAISCAAFAWSQQPRPLQVIVVCAGASLAILLRMLYVLLGPITFPRPDPYMTEGDTFRARQRRFHVLFLAATVMGFYGAFMQLYAAHLVRFDMVYICIGVSVLVQLIALGSVAAHLHDFDRRDFSVYRSPGDAKVAP